MADETQQDETQHDDATAEAAPETGAEFPAADGAGSEPAADESMQLQPADDGAVENAAGAGADDASPVENGSTAAAGDAEAAPDAEGGSPAAGAEPVAGDEPAAEPAAQPLEPGFDAEPAANAEASAPAADAEPTAVDANQSGGSEAVPGLAGGDAEAPAPAPADAPADEQSDHQTAAASLAPADSENTVDATANDAPREGGGDVELPYNSTGMAQLGTTGHTSGGPFSHPAPARVPRPIDPTTGLELTEEQHELVTGGLHKGDEPRLPSGFEDEQS